jgi:hypothetical protein
MSGLAIPKFKWIGLDHIFDIHVPQEQGEIVPVHFYQIVRKQAVSKRKMHSAAKSWGISSLGYRANLASDLLETILEQERSPIFPFISSHWVPVSTPTPTGKYDRFRAPYEISIYKPCLSASDYFAQFAISRKVDLDFLGENYKHRTLVPQFNTQTGELIEENASLTTNTGFPVWTQAATNEDSFCSAISQLHALMQNQEQLDVLTSLKVDSPILRNLLGLGN